MPERAQPGSRLRVLRLYFHLDIGGIESRLVDLLPRLDREKFDVRLLCTRRHGRLALKMEQRGIPVQLQRLPGKFPLSWSAGRLARRLRRDDVDIVHAHGERLAHLATLAARKAATPVVIANFHNVQLFQRRGELSRERRQAALRDAVIHVSEQAQRDYVERVGAQSHGGVVIYNGVDIAFFAQRQSVEELSGLARELGIEGRHPVLLNVARLHRDKAHEILLEAFRHVRERFPAAVLLLLGGGRRRRAIEGMVRDLGLHDGVLMSDVRTEMRGIYQLADVNVLASNREGFSNVVLEAMAAGVPQVLTDVGGNREAVGDSGAALLAPPRDPQRLATALLRVLENPGEAEAMRRAAAERVQRFSVERQVEQTERLYLDLARRKGLVRGAGA